MHPQQPGKVRNGLLAIRVSSDKQGRDGDSPEEQRQRGQNLADNHNITVIDTIILVESASHDDQPMQQIVERCKTNPAITFVLIKAIDRFTRGGSSAYIKLKEQLDSLGVTLLDTFGIIDGRRVNTLEHTGFKYYWSDYSPSFKSEILEAEHAKDELRDIMTRMIGAEIHYTKLGYWMRQPPYGYRSEKVNTPNGKRLILMPESEEASYMIRLFEMRAEGIYTDQQVADELNRLGFRTRIQYVRDKYDKTKVVKQIGGRQMTAKMVDRYSHNLIYAGIIKEKWSNNEPIKAQFDGLVSPELFNKANRGKLFIEIDIDNNVTVRRKRPPEYLVNKNMHNPDFPYKKVVGCSQCGSTLLGSASRGKLGKYYPAYHCSKNGHYFRVPKAAFEQTIEDVVKRLQINPEHLDALLGTIETKWNDKQAQVIANDKKLEQRRKELETQISAVIDRMKIVSSETVIKRMEEEVVNIEKQIAELHKTDDQPANTVDIQAVLQYARYLVEHLPDILLHLRNPLRKAAFFGAIFNTVPTYENLVGGTQKTAHIPGVNELFRVGRFENPNMVISPGIEPGLSG
jgi:site-specific DNA recombinase